MIEWMWQLIKLKRYEGGTLFLHFGEVFVPQQVLKKMSVALLNTFKYV